MTVVAERPTPQLAVARPAGRGPLNRLGPAWPLKLLLLGFPLWWALGVASFAFQAAAVAMAVQMARRGIKRLPAGFGVWLLFLAWMLAGATMLWVDAPGTVGGGGPERLVGFAYRVGWYLAVTVAMLYPLSLPAAVVPARAVARWLSALFLMAVTGGLAGILAPNFEFTSLAEAVIPGAGQEGSFLNTLVHPSLTTSSDFLGYDQPRPKAPFLYANAWGNNTGLLLPFFVFVGLTSERLSRRLGTVAVMGLLALPVAYSLNRGLWLGLCMLAIYAAVALARAGRLVGLWALSVGTIVAVVVLVSSPLWQTITLRLDTPHSNDRRATVAEVVTGTTWQGSPLLGYGTTRKVAGSFASIAGGGTTECRQCAAPPLGTQGFLWRLIFTTGFVGTALFMTFIAVQLFAHVRRRDPFCVLGCITIMSSLLFFFVYDSLESPLFILGLAIGLMNRARLDEDDASSALSASPAGDAQLADVR